MDMIRGELFIGPGELSKEQLWSVWLRLDEDQSGSINAGEFGAFMRLGQEVLQGKEAPGSTRRSVIQHLDAKAKDAAALRRAQEQRKETRKQEAENAKSIRSARVQEQRERDLEVAEKAEEQVMRRTGAAGREVRADRDKRTHRDLRREMAKLGAQPASHAEVLALSKALNSKMRDLFTDPLKRDPHEDCSWFRLFRHMDDDGSGLIAFDEFEEMVRGQLQMSLAEISRNVLWSVWIVLDADSSGHINAGEFGAFMRLGEVDMNGGLTAAKASTNRRLENQQKAATARRKEVDRNTAHWKRTLLITELEKKTQGLDYEAKRLEQELGQMKTGGGTSARQWACTLKSTF
jgi:Ca2+-binding EF-hand superfamily protein